jgi:hypothetical protein
MMVYQGCLRAQRCHIIHKIVHLPLFDAERCMVKIGCVHKQHKLNLMLGKGQHKIHCLLTFECFLIRLDHLGVSTECTATTLYSIAGEQQANN